MSTEDSQRPIISLVALLAKPRPLSEAELRKAVLNAWGLELGSDPAGEGDWVAAVERINPEMKHPRAQNFLLSANGRMYLVNSAPDPYMEDPAEFAMSYTDLRLQKAVGSHRAWISADVFGDPPDDDEKPQVYSALGRLLVEFENDDWLALYCPELERVNEYNPELIQALQSVQPLDLFTAPTQPPVVEISADDPRLLAAIEEMRSRWPEFVAAFRANRNRENIFGVKARFNDGGEDEFMWVAVHSIGADNSITGHIDNEPAIVQHVKEGDVVTVNLDDLNDWVYIIDEKPTGGFTMKLMEQIHNQDPVD